jgi:hypothetical protein
LALAGLNKPRRVLGHASSNVTPGGVRWPSGLVCVALAEHTVNDDVNSQELHAQVHPA